MGDRTICFIDKQGDSGICTIEGLDEKQIVKIMGQNVIDCRLCPFRKKFEGKEFKHFSYVVWIGELGNSYNLDISQTKPDGSFLCPSCKNLISPDDDTDENYLILEVDGPEGEEEKILIQCQKCKSKITLSLAG